MIQSISPAKIRKCREKILELKKEFSNSNEKELGISQGLTMAIVILSEELGRDIVYERETK